MGQEISWKCLILPGDTWAFWGHNVESPGSAARPLVMCPNGTIFFQKKNLSVLESAIVFHLFFLDFLKKRCPKSAGNSWVVSDMAGFCLADVQAT